ncbi:MAG: Asp-tRNA(Asn)/Glu-tRNA(Gln) amidotransferase subunit GatB [Candidatus Daviesbacteria bacterium]|nr:Asp-tRNA(Asn)/Glu-tRNA(Gln) amidotransferase subunit GatB [Candidatus Daviesbacteria bacterium]
MNSYEAVIGLEIHVELNTKSKMFCRCSADYFGAKPNTHTCPICLGLPGSLPFINEEAINSCIKIGLALNCEISKTSRFERKNYFYPDLPKGYQISQYRWPLCVAGKLKMEDGRWIRINRVHQEEDTAKLFHIGGGTQIDFNRSGVPLVEVVTEPDFREVGEVREYAKKLQQIFRYLGISNADMERGDMRLEANVSVRKVNESLRGLAVAKTRQSDAEDRHADARDDKTLPNYRIELKNINSFRFMVAAIEYEIKRQIEALENGEKLTQETRGWDEDKKETYLQRSKEEAHDYRYFPDPDLPEIKVDRLQVTVDSIKKEIPEMPWEKEERFINDYGVSVNNAKILIETRESAEYFEKTVKLGKEQQLNPQEIANYIINQKIDLASQDQVLRAVEEIASKKIGVIGDVGELEKLAEEAIKENPDSIEAFKNGKLGALNVLLGAIMKKTNGKADASKTMEILKNLLK